MRLLLATKWAERYFDTASRPDPRTARKWVEIHEVPGRIINGVAYVDLDQWDGQRTGNALADKIIQQAVCDGSKTKKPKPPRVA